MVCRFWARLHDAARCQPVGKNSFRIVLTQGLNRQIRRMCRHFDYNVRRLQRVRIMHLRLGRLAPGEWRPLSAGRSRAAARDPHAMRRRAIPLRRVRRSACGRVDHDGGRRHTRRDAPPGLRSMLCAMAYNNAWANHRLLRACCSLSSEEFVAHRTGFFPSLRATLNHILTVDWLYVDAIERSLAGRPHNTEADRFFEPPEPCADCASLSAEQHAVDARLIAVCDVPAGPRSRTADMRSRVRITCNASGSTVCWHTSSSIRSTTAARRMRCSRARPSNHRSSTSSSPPRKRRCAPQISRSSASTRSEIWEIRLTYQRL